MRKPALKILIANQSSKMGFSNMRNAFRPIRRDLSKHTTDFIQQVQVPCVQTSITGKLCVPIDGLQSRDETAMLVDKTIANYGSYFA